MDSGLLGAEISVKQNALMRGGGQHRGHARRVSRPGVEEQVCTGSSSMPAGLGQGWGGGRDHEHIQAVSRVQHSQHEACRWWRRLGDRRI